MWKIAIVDDDFQVLRGLRRAIPWEELEAEFVGDAINGEEGIRLIEAANPDIIITDIYMPHMSGIEMIEQLRRNHFPGRFIILSGYNDFEFARTAIRLGVEDYLTKPGTVEQIRDVLTNTIAKLEASYLQNIEQNELASRNESLDGMTSEEWLAAVVSGQPMVTDLPGSKKAWNDKSHQVIVLEAVRTERLRGVSIADWNLFQFAIANIAIEIMGQEGFDADFVWLFGNYAAIIMHEDLKIPHETARTQADALGRLLVESIRKYIGLELRYGLGDVRSSWQDIKLSADQALQSLFAMAEAEENPAASTPGKPAAVASAGSAMGNSGNPKHKKAVDFMIRYIHEHYAEDLTLEEFAKQLYISKNYLNQLFKKVTGETLTNYIIRVRIEKAKSLLFEGNHLIYEVAEMVGYQNVPYFTTLFKKYCGVTPSELTRRQIKQ
ncbi:response regulator transcription factor [Cohnella lubricantis]|uniref:Response regulator transcription factor n=1 Tax=Cohnella lubricantis TaxID=2163172 RepID=A0A841TBZ8_9BACL|nr:response regulator transcription factor [Cohnella lubricantis]MBB6676898.1 response regulator transcription factor [Cohnella lubricantis]MBP2118299.1 two-component system response regulator YesN [Cohnella lubricantis]